MAVVRDVRAGLVRGLRPCGLTQYVLEVEVGRPWRRQLVRVEYGGWAELCTPAGWTPVSSTSWLLRRALLDQYPLSSMVERICLRGAR